MITNVNRLGRFTSSKIAKLLSTGRGPMGFGAGAITYIKSRIAERQLGRSTDLGVSAKPMSWGKVMEKVMFALLSGEYSMVSAETVAHPKYSKFWSGSPDMTKNDNVTCEVKCFYPDNFYWFSRSLLTKDIDHIKTEWPDEYWQVVSNAIIMGHKRAELFAFMPTKTQLREVAKLISETDFILTELHDTDVFKYKWISDDVEKNINTLPFMPDNSDWPNLVSFEFEIPVADVVLLTQTVLKAEECGKSMF